SLSKTKYAQGEQVRGFYHQVLQQVQSLPGIRHAAIATSLPLNGTYFGMPFSIGRPTNNPSELHGSPFQIVSPGYFRAMGIPLLTGRDFTEQDTSRAPFVAVVNQGLVRRFF